MQRLLATTTTTTSGRIRTAGDAYRVLSVRMNAPFEEVKGAYFELAKKHHPDVVAAQGGDPDEAHAYFLQLGESYALLKELKEREAAGASSSRAGSSSAAGSHAWWNVWLRPGSGPGALLGDDSVDTTNARWETHIRRSDLAATLDRWIFGADANSLIEELIGERDLETALAVFEHLKASTEGAAPTQSTYAMLIRGCTINMRRTGVDTDNVPDPYTASLLEIAKDLFAELQTEAKFKPYESTIHEMIRAYGKAGDYDAAYELFDKLLFTKFVRPTNLVCNSILEAALHTGHHKDAHKVLEILDGAKSLLKPLHKPDARTFGLTIQNSVEGGYFEVIPDQLRMLGSNFLYPDRPTSEKIVTAALEAGDVDAADRILRCLPEVGASPLDESALQRLDGVRQRKAQAIERKAQVTKRSEAQATERSEDL